MINKACAYQACLHDISSALAISSATCEHMVIHFLARVHCFLPTGFPK